MRSTLDDMDETHPYDEDDTGTIDPGSDLDESTDSDDSETSKERPKRARKNPPIFTYNDLGIPSMEEARWNNESNVNKIIPIGGRLVPLFIDPVCGTIHQVYSNIQEFCDQNKSNQLNPLAPPFELNHNDLSKTRGEE